MSAASRIKPVAPLSESRTGKRLTGTYPEVHAAIAAQRARGLVLDGELVAFDGEQTSFARLQQRVAFQKAAYAT